MKALLLVVFIAGPAFADWTRHVHDPKGGVDDKPDPQTLRYFTQYPSLHDGTGEFCYLCSDERKLAAAKKQKVRADVLFLGRVNGRAVYDILYYFNDDPKPNWKSLVVQRSGDRYGEVLQVHDYTREGIHHSTLVKEGDQQLIYAVDNCDRSGCSSVCFRIDRDGPVFVDIPPSDR